MADAEKRAEQQRELDRERRERREAETSLTIALSACFGTDARRIVELMKHVFKGR